MRRFRARVPIAWNNVFQNPRRTAKAMAGIAFAVLLIFLQMGLLRGVRASASMAFEFFRFDHAIVSDKYQYMADADRFDAMRLHQASVTPGVDAVYKINLNPGTWTNLATEHTCQAIVFGVDLDPGFVGNEDVRRGVEAVRGDTMVLVDRYSIPDYGSLVPGTRAKINQTKTSITGAFTLGVTLFSEGAVIVDNGLYDRLYQGQSRKATLGLLRMKPGADPAQVKQALRQALPADTLVFTRDELIRHEQDYFVTVKPVGIMFQAGVIVAFIVGVVILFQVLSTDISNRLHEFATMKAMGFSHRSIYAIGIRQALIFALMSYAPSFLLTLIVFKILTVAAHLHVGMTWDLGLVVLGLTMGMCTISCALALQKVRATDPAELF